ncbi:DNA polymerase III subunit delta [Peptoniphilus stercorisuis]|uniref:DNA polymerase III subunit delta n=1 Tax=Peptoniphilus stercorisuis TaxID=1436965 RepID=A0ABS4KAG4_9FIRM|nr:DNA polymerase III subunit delta [Peptoniphilus stercorisuis]MBP2024774.1 DNA polymerase-3 subunit delta [Peptoniphilus stercorisuis]
MDYKEIYKNELSGAYLFYGIEKLLIDNACDYIVKKYINNGMEIFNLTNFEGKDLDAKDIMSACETLPVMNEKRVIFVKDVAAFSENVSDEFYDFLDNLADYVIIIFLDTNDNLNKVKKFYKYFSKRKRNVEFTQLKGRDIYKFVEGYIARKNKKIYNVDLSYLISKSSYGSRNVDISLYDLKNEIDKIIALTKTDTITREIIDSSLTENTDTNIFMFLDAMCERDTEKALIEFRNLHSLNEPIQKILFMLTRQVRLLIIYKTLSFARYRESDIMSEMGVKKYEYSKIQRFSRNFKLEFLYDFYKMILEFDEKIKTSSGEDLILFEMLIVKFTS